MRRAVYAGNTSQLDNAREYFEKWKKRGVLFKEDYFLSTEELCRAVEEKNYSAIIVYVDSDWAAKESVFNQLKQKEQDSIIIYICGRKDQWKKLSRAKYTAVFNGQPIVYNMEDICFLESYDRKTSVVLGKKKIRVKARLDVEEQRLSNYHFARINQYTLINMLHIRSMEGDEIRMANGEKLYISSSRRKLFMEKYMQFAQENFSVV